MRDKIRKLNQQILPKNTAVYLILWFGCIFSNIIYYFDLKLTAYYTYLQLKIFDLKIDFTIYICDII